MALQRSGVEVVLIRMSLRYHPRSWGSRRSLRRSNLLPRMEYANRDDAVKKREFRPSLRGKLPSVKTNRNNSFPRKKLRYLHQGWALFLGTSEEQFISGKKREAPHINDFFDDSCHRSNRWQLDAASVSGVLFRNIQILTNHETVLHSEG